MVKHLTYLESSELEVSLKAPSKHGLHSSFTVHLEGRLIYFVHFVGYVRTVGVGAMTSKVPPNELPATLDLAEVSPDGSLSSFHLGKFSIVGGESNKSGANTLSGRDIVGAYRCLDGTEGSKSGEVAVTGSSRDHSLLPNEYPNGPMSIKPDGKKAMTTQVPLIYA